MKDVGNLFLLYAFGMGAYLSLVYDGLRIFRRLIAHKLFWMSLEDFIFWIYSTVIVFLLLYRQGDGQLRWFAILAAMAGIWLYHKLISPFLVKYVVKAIKLLLTVLFSKHKM